MNDKYKRKIEKIKNMPYSKYVSENKIRDYTDIKKDEKKTSLKNILKTAAYIFLGIGNKEKVENSNHRTGSIPMPSAREWRDQNRFDPEEYYWERRRADDYYRAIDGRGDPQEHECHCNHDDER